MADPSHAQGWDSLGRALSSFGVAVDTVLFAIGTLLAWAWSLQRKAIDDAIKAVDASRKQDRDHVDRELQLLNKRLDDGNDRISSLTSKIDARFERQREEWREDMDREHRERRR